MLNKCFITFLIKYILLALILLLFIISIAYYDFAVWWICTVFLCAMMHSVKTVTCGGLQYWSCASQDLCDTRDTGVSQAAQAVCICTVAWVARKPCIFER